MPTKCLMLHNADNLEAAPVQCEYDEVSTSPVCNFAIIPHVISGFYVENEPPSDGYDEYTVFLLSMCPHCRNAFLAKYSAYRSNGLHTTHLCGLYPRTLAPSSFSQPIQNISPMFTETFSQSETAEAEDLLEIAGCGYRKSVEYLVKDYLCHKTPDQAEAIKGEFLGTAIKRIDDIRVRTLAERAVWIGNDETHYIKKHEALDITDMKRFITAMLHYIESELLFEEALSISPER